MSTIPSPALLAAKQPVRTQAVEVDTTAQAVRPGIVTEEKTVINDGIVKAKNLKPGQVVRPYLNGEARGAAKVVDKVERLGDGAFVRVSYSSAHQTVEVKAGYRFYDESLDGKPEKVTVKRPGFVPAHA